MAAAGTVLGFGGGFVLRHATAEDHAGLAVVCLRTGDAGRDASAVEDEPELLGLIYAIPYQVFEPGLAFAIEGPDGVAGYLFGVAGTRAFNARLAAEWYPALRRRFPDPGADRSAWQGSDRLRRLIHHPDFAIPEPLAAYPSHGHIDLLPEARGRGIGKRAMEFLCRRLASARSPGLHLQVHPRNESALRFYAALGFEKIENMADPDIVYLGKRLDPALGD